ncbi:carboxypeptidase regulatory-like domain-containing protein [Actinokineospora spheciospongiae]|uniref:carboxypeptidase regulatory-like domain-containing protein n=1 Tax=Actinokineospora spheciospongiae TaxID=909613 RepID=UPI001C644518|nr:carboxypeptidase regulatory-like domain-containing protein [Actinokineospora spheciospongiae]
MSASHHRRRPRGRTTLTLTSAVLGLLGALTVPAVAAPAAPSPNDKIDTTVAAAFDAKDSTDFWVSFTDKADLSGPSRVADWNARGQAVVDALRATADRSQASVRKELDAAEVDYKPFYIANALRVHNGSEALATSLAAHGEVRSILPARTYELPKPLPSQAVAEVNSVEWGLAAINADDVWSQFGVRGEGVVVGNIDSGVEFDHPALVGKYRGNSGGGTFDHNHNWFDPAEVCPSAAPCDNNGHGTHTMGTMVGDDGAGNQVGVAPGARWIAAKGCETNGCSDASLLASGEWMLAPTDLTGADPRPDLRPQVVNNSWGSSNGATIDPWYRDTVNAWRAAGIFPSFSNGNSGPSCNTAGSPGDNTESYASGAFDSAGAIASFSSRGPGENGDVKPNIAAPGDDVRSSVPGGGYELNSGTSMAAPHTSGTVALMWSAAPSLVGDITRTQELLDESATDVNDTACGGTAADNNVWGEGKLDAFAAVDRSPRGPVGTLAGHVTDAAGGAPVAGATVVITGPSNRTLTTDATGAYGSVLPVGDYTVAVSAFGYGSGSGTATVTEDETVTREVVLTPVARHTVSGTVLDAQGGPVANATVQVLSTPIPAVTTDAAGAYSIPNVPEGGYRVTASAGGCSDPQTKDVVVDGDEVVGFTLPSRADSFGNHCVLDTAPYVEGDTPLALTGDDSAVAVPLPFSFFFYGNNYTQAFASTNGHLNFLASSTAYSNVALPAGGAPNAAIYPFWDDLLLDSTSRVATKTTGTAPNREFVVEWRNATFYQATATRVDFEVVLSESGEISLRYRGIDPNSTRERGASATVGIENATGTVALQYSLNAPALADGQSIRFKLPPTGIATGRVTDANDKAPISGATVRVLKAGAETAKLTTDADGRYRARLLAGTYSVEVTKPNYATQTKNITVSGDLTVNFALKTPRAELPTAPLTFLGQSGQLRTAVVTLKSTSDLALDYTLASNAPWAWAVPGSATLKPGQQQDITVRVDPTGLLPGVHQAAVTLTTNAGRTPTLVVPVTLVVPAYRTGVDVGATAGHTDRAADSWVADRAWTPGGYGYLSNGPVVTTKKAIAGTEDDTLFQTQRESAGGYRFDALPAGTYQVELSFAELKPAIVAGKRVFDVSLNGTKVLANHDIAATVGTLTADTREFWVTVPEGGSISVELAALRGKQPPVVNSIRLTHRPDRALP